MSRKLPAPKKTTTHFEQIPIDIVKKIVPADREPRKVPARNGSTPASAGGGHFHGVQFYNDVETLCRIVGGFIEGGLAQDSLAVIIATPDHTARIESCLRDSGIDVDEVKRSGQLFTFDARATLELFMRADGMPNPGAFRRALGEILTGIRHGRERCTIRAYGEMVDLLWKDGHEAAAIRLETLWNQLGTTHEFALLCGYSMGNFYKGAALDEIKSQHSHAGDQDGDASAWPAAM